ncbi:hypothetical protein EV127DRAFT_49064 [Xylaria flabelliformis]|nr:hypothetical protein EV127DRAFT_49064 [Xylaria flabelliformis]
MFRDFRLTFAFILLLQVQTAFCLWCLTQVPPTLDLWFSDGQPISEPRGNDGASYRLIIKEQGFLDLTEIPTSPLLVLDANGAILSHPGSIEKEGPLEHDVSPPPCVGLSLHLRGNSSFTLMFTDAKIGTENHTSTASVSGKLKLLPNISVADVAFIDTMIERNYIPYQNIPDAPGKTVEEIKALGLRLFPFSPYSFQLAMCVYDWTTASFTRMVLLKVFEYTGIPPLPFPLDRNSLAEQIWTSNWETYTPQNQDYMHSFIMKPADSLEDVKAQLSEVASDLQRFSTVENSMLSAALQSLPRTPVFQHPQLYSGQVDIAQMGLDHFGIEFLEYPHNEGPVGQELITGFADVLQTYVSAGKTITTKMAWSFTDSVESALHYANGILLVANFPQESAVWDTVAYVTALSDDPNKTEYLFAPRTQFEVQCVDKATVNETQVVVITLQPLPNKIDTGKSTLFNRVEQTLPSGLNTSQIIDKAKTKTYTKGLPHSLNRTAGRRCACINGAVTEG